jgi:hypothetical protein
MPEIRTIKRARRTMRQGKAPMIVSGELVRDEIATGLAKPRRVGGALRAPKKATAKTRVVVSREVKRAKKPRRASPRRSAALLLTPKRKTRKAASSRTTRRASTKRRARARSIR